MYREIYLKLIEDLLDLPWKVFAICTIFSYLLIIVVNWLFSWLFTETPKITPKIVNLTLEANEWPAAGIKPVTLPAEIVIKFGKKMFNVLVIDQEVDFAAAIEKLREHCEDKPVLGFDCEWVTWRRDRQKVALIQLCSTRGLCILFRTCKIEVIPQELVDLLEDSLIFKTGILPFDAKHLNEDYGINMKGTIDLNFLAVLESRKPEGLKKLAKSVLNLDIDKNPNISHSNWEDNVLSQSQINYAATDVIVSLLIFRVLYSALNKRFSTFYYHPLCKKFIDITFNFSVMEKMQSSELLEISREDLRNRMEPHLTKSKAPKTRYVPDYKENLESKYQNLLARQVLHNYHSANYYDWEPEASGFILSNTEIRSINLEIKRLKEILGHS